MHAGFRPPRAACTGEGAEDGARGVGTRRPVPSGWSRRSHQRVRRSSEKGDLPRKASSGCKAGAAGPQGLDRHEAAMAATGSPLTATPPGGDVGRPRGQQKGRSLGDVRSPAETLQRNLGADGLVCGRSGLAAADLVPPPTGSHPASSPLTDPASVWRKCLPHKCRRSGGRNLPRRTGLGRYL
jgi:hypothetical protein